MTDETPQQKRRKAAMAVLAHAEAADIAGRLGAIALPAPESPREPENGLVMGRGRRAVQSRRGHGLARRGAACDRRDRFWLCARPRPAKGADDRVVRRADPD